MGFIYPPVSFPRSEAQKVPWTCGNTVSLLHTNLQARNFQRCSCALLAFEAQDPNVEWNMMAIAVDQNAAQCILCHSVSSGMRKKELLLRHHWVIFSTG